MSFRREKFIPFGGPDGGNGGRGGSVYATADRNLNTLIDYRYARRHEARNGEPGRGSDQFGAAAEDIVLRMPVGTILRDLGLAEKPRLVVWNKLDKVPVEERALLRRQGDYLVSALDKGSFGPLLEGIAKALWQEGKAPSGRLPAGAADDRDDGEYDGDSSRYSA